MYIKALFVLLTALTINISLGFAQGKNPTQDSVRKVYIKVTAAEKPKMVSIDSLKEANIIAKPAAKAKKKPLTAKATTPATAIKAKPATNLQATIKAQPTAVAKTTTIAPEASKNTSTTTNSNDVKVVISPKETEQPVSASTNTTTPAPVVDDHHHDEDIVQADIVEDGEISNGGNLKTSKTYLWVGIVLMVVGLILGILFGKTALLISIAGMVFVIIGYTIRT